jgi:hypothetical protein
MTLNILVAIPTRSNWKMLGPLLESLKEFDVSLYDNGHTSEEGKSLLANHTGEVCDATGWKFYKMWNHAWMTASLREYDCVALLNDDIVLHEKSLEVSYNVLMSSSEIGIVGLNYHRSLDLGTDDTLGFVSTPGSYKDGGIWGCAFLVKSSLWGVVPPIDERYHLWYGDDELFTNTRRCGYDVGIAKGAPVLHYPSTTTNMHTELLARVGEDEILFKSKFT